MTKRFYTILVILSLCFTSLLASEMPKSEVRAVWLTTIGGLDWPHSYAQTPKSIEKQQHELREILDKLKAVNINTVLIQTRIRATSIFPTSSLSGNEPWDGCLSGRPGQSPGYDALKFAIDECHRRGMECHAWIVTIPLGKWNGAGCRHVRNIRPSLVIKIGDDGFMNPSKEGTADYLASYCVDVVRRYDVDGIHLDYIRYPEEMKKLPSGNVGRANITRIVEAVHRSVKYWKPWVKLSCSPIGKHDDTRQYWSHGWNARSRVFQDAKEWMRRGLMDQEYPMMYFRGNNFYPFAVDWQEGSYGKMVVPGLGIYMMHPKEKNWALTDITRELQVLRTMGLGHCFFRNKFLLDNTKGIYDYLCQTFNLYPALVPPTHGNGFKVPTAPYEIKVTKTDVSTILSWGSGIDNSDGNYIMYNIYCSETYPVDTNDARNLIAMRVTQQELSIRTSASMYYAVTAMDRYGNESKACQMNINTKIKDYKPGWWYVTRPVGH